MRLQSLFRIALFATAATAAMAGQVVIDGVFSPGEWGAPVKHVSPYLIGTDGAQQSVDLYWNADDPLRIYGAVVGDPSLASWAQVANVYVYSSTGSTRPDGSKGTYGDGDDIIIESGNKWHFSLDGAITNVWAGPDQLLQMSTNGTTSSGSDGLVSLAYDTSTLVTEFSIDRSLLGNYDKYRYGGQLFASEFNTGSDSREPGALVASAPEPGTWSLFAIGAGLVGLARRYRR